jgi:excisionase family DNA binding protein
MTISENVESSGILLTLGQASKRLGIAIPTLRRWLRERRLAHVRCGRAIRIEASEVSRFIETHRQPASKDPKASAPADGDNQTEREGSR